MAWNPKFGPPVQTDVGFGQNQRTDSRRGWKRSARVSDEVTALGAKTKKKGTTSCSFQGGTSWGRTWKSRWEKIKFRGSGGLTVDWGKKRNHPLSRVKDGGQVEIKTKPGPRRSRSRAWLKGVVIRELCVQEGEGGGPLATGGSTGQLAKKGKWPEVG